MRPSLALLLALTSCDYSGDFLFPAPTEGLDDVYVLLDANEQLLIPTVVTTVDELRAATIYSEIGPPTTTAYGGVTVDFVGTGGDVCIWVDPETASWNQAVAPRPDALNRKWAYPDNFFDDGDIDLFAGLSVYYTGSPGEVIGDFVVAYEDSLGNDIPISLAACPNQVGPVGDAATAGRGSPDFCTIPATDLGISYTVLLRTWSTPLDDARLTFGFLLADGSCENIRTIGASFSQEGDECVIQGESLIPDPKEFGPFYGFDAVTDRIWPGSIEFETTICNPESRMAQYCGDEVDAFQEADLACERESLPDVETRCYCGDINDTPEGGAN